MAYFDVPATISMNDARSSRYLADHQDVSEEEFMIAASQPT
jgi:hypothetical protein